MRREEPLLRGGSALSPLELDATEGDGVVVDVDEEALVADAESTKTEGEAAGEFEFGVEVDLSPWGTNPPGRAVGLVFVSAFPEYMECGSRAKTTS